MAFLILQQTQNKRLTLNIKDYFFSISYYFLSTNMKLVSIIFMAWLEIIYSLSVIYNLSHAMNKFV